jgi:signal transduction histidine kinase/streptogramin lyase
MALDGGVVFLGGDKPQLFATTTDGSAARPSALIEDREGAAWIAYEDSNPGGEGGALFRIKDGKAMRFTERDGLPVGRPSIAADREGRIWFVVNGQVGIFRDDRFATLCRFPNILTRLAGSASGGIWVCSGWLLYKFDESGNTVAHGSIHASNPKIRPNVMLEDRMGAVWIGSRSGGLLRYDGSSFENVLTTHRSVSCLMEDRDGNMWVGSSDMGLNRVQPRVITVEAEAGSPSERVHSLTQDASGIVWGVSQDGMLLRRTAKSGWVSTDLIRGGGSTCVAADAAGGVWIGSAKGRLDYLRNGEVKSFGRTAGLGTYDIRSLLVTKAGDVWIAGRRPDGVECLRAGQIRRVQLPSKGGGIYPMLEDHDGNILLGTKQGLLRIRSDDLTAESVITTALPQAIRCLYRTSDGCLWIGYAGDGLGRLKNDRFVQITTKHGLPDDAISQIIADKSGRLWIGADRGIFKLKPEAFDDVASGKVSHLRVTCFGTESGIPALQASFGTMPHTLRTENGQLWMPMRTALAIIDPENWRDDLVPPPVWLTRVAVDDRTMASSSNLIPNRQGLNLANLHQPVLITPQHHKVQFEFAALGYRAPENIRFRYRLEGFDRAWIDAGTERSAKYPRLEAGNYRFRVSACNTDGVWNESGSDLAFAVTPFIWQTWWFRILAVCMFSVCLVAVGRYASFWRLRSRLRALEQQTALEKERTRIARDLHDDLGGRLTTIVLLSDMTAEYCAIDPAKAGRDARRLSSTARQVIKSLDETVWAVNPANDTLAHLINYIGQFAVSFLKTANILCRVDLLHQPPAHAISAEIRHNVFLTIKEALNNIVRHAAATEVWLRTTVAEATVRIAVEDNGQGFAGSLDDPNADGLRNMAARMKEIGGDFHLESNVGIGTRAILTFHSLRQRSS